jgi:hypothetical protein
MAHRSLQLSGQNIGQIIPRRQCGRHC